MAILLATDDATFDTALAAAVAGDTIQLAAGNYTLAHTISVADITIEGAKAGQPGTAALRGFNEANLSGQITVTGADVTIDGVQISNESAGQFGALVVNAADVTVENSIFTGNLAVDGGPGNDTGLVISGASTGAIVTNNAFTNYDVGIFAVEGAATASINNNLFDANGAGLFTESVGLVISLNTFQNSAGTNHVFSNPNVSTDVSAQLLADNTLDATASREVQIITHAPGAQTVVGTVFDDSIFSSDATLFPGPFEFRGLAGNDGIWGNDLNDTIDGGPGNDFLEADDPFYGAGADEGTDTVKYLDSTAGVEVSLLLQGAAQDTIGAGIDTLFNFENLTGSTLNDVLTGDNDANVIRGNLGDDELFGLGGNDDMHGGSGVDILHGNLGDDVEFGGLDNDTLLGGSGDDIYDGGAGDDLLDGSQGTAPGSDTAGYITAGAGVTVNLALAGGPQDTGAAGFDTLVSISNLIGSDFADVLRGDAEDNILVGKQGNDILRGAQGDDTVFGGIGNDELHGGAGADSIVGGVGNELMFGGTAAAGDLSDSFFFSRTLGAWGNDTIMDFQATGGVQDFLRFDASVGAVTATASGLFDTLVSDTFGNSVLLKNVLVGDVADNIILGATLPTHPDYIFT